MNKTTKIVLIAAASFLLIGCILFGSAMTALKWDFSKLSTTSYETREFAIKEPFRNIRIVTDTAGISFVRTESETPYAVCYEPEKVKHKISVENETLTVSVTDTQKWYDRIGINWESPKITIYLPGSTYGTLFIREHTGSIAIPGDFSFESLDITATTGSVTCRASVSGDMKINATTGSIRVKNTAARSADLSVSTGRIIVSALQCQEDVRVRVSTGKADLTGIRCQNLHSDGNTGDLSLSDVIAAGCMMIERSTGDVMLTGSDAGEIFIKTDTGDVTGTLLSEKIFFTRTDTGRIRVPKSTAGGRCEITTDTGDIKMEIQ